MPYDTTSIPEPVLKALYAGYKYYLSLNISTASYSEGKLDSPTNFKLVQQHYNDWVRYTKEAIDLLEK